MDVSVVQRFVGWRVFHSPNSCKRFHCWGSQQTFAVFQGDGLNLTEGALDLEKGKHYTLTWKNWAASTMTYIWLGMDKTLALMNVGLTFFFLKLIWQKIWRQLPNVKGESYESWVWHNNRRRIDKPLKDIRQHCETSQREGVNICRKKLTPVWHHN